jgi:hypothetical protein
MLGILKPQIETTALGQALLKVFLAFAEAWV